MTYGCAELVRSFGIPALLEARAHVERDEVTVRSTAPGAKRLFGVVRPSSGGTLDRGSFEVGRVSSGRVRGARVDITAHSRTPAFQKTR